MNNQNSQTSGPKPANHQIQISNWRPREKNTLRGFFSAALPSGMVIHDLALHEKGNRRWVNTPVREYQNSQGQRQFAAIIEFTDEDTGIRFSNTVLAALDRYFAQTAEKKQ
jgi:hypothetical protein